jgi:hypothetical protein
MPNLSIPAQNVYPRLGEISKKNQEDLEEPPYLLNKYDSKPLDIQIDPQVKESYIALEDFKDPDEIDFKGKKYLYFSAGTVRGIKEKNIQPETWQIGVMIKQGEGPYVLQPPVFLDDPEYSIARPCASSARVLDRNTPNERISMAIHKDCFTEGGSIEEFVSYDGVNFSHKGTLIPALSGITLYDPEFFKADNKFYLAYTVRSEGRNEIHGARIIDKEDGSTEVELMGIIMMPEEIKGHNKITDSDYEWGIEAPRIRLVRNENGEEVFVGAFVSFLGSVSPSGEFRPRGTRQRVTIAEVNKLGDEFKVIGYLIEPDKDSENGHPDWNGDKIIYQARHKDGTWKLFEAKLGPSEIFKPFQSAHFLAA